MSYHEFWLERWNSEDTPWHQEKPEELLLKHFSASRGARVLVPLCGKSLDMLWLSHQGYQVVGIELSELAGKSFFKDHNLEFQKISRPPFKMLKTEKIEIFCGDFFELSPEILGPIDAIYDRAALIALKPELRESYIKILKRLVQKSNPAKFEWLLIGRQNQVRDLEGPPYDLSEDDLKTLCGEDFIVEVLDRVERESRRDPEHKVFETVFRLSHVET
ncbi:MAG: thiopurine S-methyltransferase [Deltaproteobacteria bacterium CG11_big_fil_rev_8_21_14_0_20_45_16]|nr:MAG: thiopurine S-methyltransferase [Deltaproteobacteria bacterium CG11_big_fil_rev_8_21_14_0_20_45_16]